MTSLVMRHLKVAVEEPADLAALILTARILEIFSEIFLEICLAVAAEADSSKQWTDERCEYPQEQFVLHLKRQCLDVRKSWSVILKDPCPKSVMEPVQNRELHPETCPKCGGKGQVVYTPAVIFRYGTECPDLSGLWRNR